ncbi:hypothetical protein D3C78_1399010 [compost metagenome]
MSRDHVGRNRPGRAAKAEKRRFIRQGLTQTGNGFENGRKMRHDICGIQLLDTTDIDRVHGRTLAFAEGDVAVKRVGYHQNIGKENCGIQPEPANGLESDLRCQLGVITEIEETSGTLPRFPILGKIAPSLSHQPNGRRRDRLPVQHRHNLAFAHGT